MLDVIQIVLYSLREIAVAAQIVDLCPPRNARFHQVLLHISWYAVAELRNDVPAAQSAFMVARSDTEKIVRAQPKNEKALSVLALIDAYLGQKEKALQEGRTASDMLPVTKDAVDGVC